MISTVLALSTGRASVFRNEPWKSLWTPAEMAALLERHGFGVVQEIDLVETAEGLGLELKRRRVLGYSRVMVGDRNPGGGAGVQGP
ncbi:hypothetical protein [Cryptosporangium sp. NPDC048952]|uniref:hypothetical protein n=1 Tax=Cryptosporangium sp. NPDC048952 TaxID=3363961 RepID=UPI003718C3F5